MLTRTSADRNARATSSPTRVLVVDDSPSFRKMLRFALEQGGFDVLEAATGMEALGMVDASRIGLVLTDQNLPGIDGLTLVRTLRGRPGFETLPILVLTTESGDDLKAAGREAGATGWMVKPFDPDRLLDFVRRVLR